MIYLLKNPVQRILKLCLILLKYRLADYRDGDWQLPQPSQISLSPSQRRWLVGLLDKALTLKGAADNRLLLMEIRQYQHLLKASLDSSFPDREAVWLLQDQSTRQKVRLN